MLRGETLLAFHCSLFFRFEGLLSHLFDKARKMFGLCPVVLQVFLKYSLGLLSTGQSFLAPHSTRPALTLALALAVALLFLAYFLNLLKYRHYSSGSILR
jgi:hypothetical protein